METTAICSPTWQTHKENRSFYQRLPEMIACFEVKPFPTKGLISVGTKASPKFLLVFSALNVSA